MTTWVVVASSGPHTAAVVHFALVDVDADVEVVRVATPCGRLVGEQVFARHLGDSGCAVAGGVS